MSRKKDVADWNIEPSRGANQMTEKYLSPEIMI